MLDLLRDVGLVTRTGIEEARGRLNGNSAGVLDDLVGQGCFCRRYSRSLAAPGAHDLGWIKNLGFDAVEIDRIAGRDGRRL